MSTDTYLALFRKIEDSFVYQDSGLLHLWIHCLIKASFKDRTIMFDGTEVELKRGQFITGRKSLAKALRTTEQKIRSRIALLEKHNQIVLKSTNKYSIITVVNYSHYQDDHKKITNKQPADNQQITTNNKDNKVNNNNKGMYTYQPVDESGSPYRKKAKSTKSNSAPKEVIALAFFFETESQKVTGVKPDLTKAFFKIKLAMKTHGLTPADVRELFKHFLTDNKIPLETKVSLGFPLSGNYIAQWKVGKKNKPVSQVEASLDIKL